MRKISNIGHVVVAIGLMLSSTHTANVAAAEHSGAGKEAAPSVISAAVETTKMQEAARSRLDEVQKQLKIAGDPKANFDAKLKALIAAIDPLCEAISVDIIGRIKSIQDKSKQRSAGLEKEIDKINTEAATLAQDIKDENARVESPIPGAVNAAIIPHLKENIEHLRHWLENLRTNLPKKSGPLVQKAKNAIQKGAYTLAALFDLLYYLRPDKRTFTISDPEHTGSTVSVNIGDLSRELQAQANTVMTWSATKDTAQLENQLAKAANIVHELRKG